MKSTVWPQEGSHRPPGDGRKAWPWGPSPGGRRLPFTSDVVGSLRVRFHKLRLEGISDLPRSGPPRKIGDDQMERLIEETLHSNPPGATHWSTRKMAKKMDISRDSVSPIWRAFGLKPHRADSFQISTDPHDVDKVRDVVGLYMSPPENALVLCVDEKKPDPGLGTLPACLCDAPRQSRRTYARVLSPRDRHLVCRPGCEDRPCARKMLRPASIPGVSGFLRNIESHVAGDVAAGKEVHLILDNYATHKSATIMKWLIKRPHWHLHFTLTHASWLNQVERFFALITTESIRRGNFLSVPALVTAIRRYLDHNAQPKPFVWSATADRILEKTANFSKSML